MFAVSFRKIVLGMAALLLSGASLAANDNFDGSVVSNCSYTSATKSYACTALSTSNNITIADGYTVVLSGSMDFDFNQQLTMSGTAKLQTTGSLDIGDIKTTNLNITGGTLVAGTNFKIGAQVQTITANITAASMTIGTGSATKITGSLSSTGPVTLASHVTLIGPVSGTTITTNSPVTMTGDVSATSAFTLASGSTLTGDITAPTVTLSPSGSTVTGDIAAATSLTIGSGNQVTGAVSGGALTMAPSGTVITGNVSMTGDIDIGSGDTINGNLVGRNVSTASSDGYISGNASVNSLTLNWHGRVGGIITCTGAGASGCSCVTNNSGYTSAPNAPVCGAAPAPAIDHIQITHPTTGATCGQPVTITLCANASCSSTYSGSASVTLTPNSPAQSFTITGSGSASIQSAAANGVSITASASGVTGATTCRYTDGSNSNCKIDFKNALFTFDIPDHVADSATPFTMRAIQQSASDPNTCVAALTGTRTVNFSCSYNNPAAPPHSVPVLINGSALGANSSSACGSTQGITVTFDSAGSANLTAQYAEVGSVKVNASFSSLSGNDSFIAGPAGFRISAAAGSTSNPAASDENGAKFLGAGQTFTTTVSAINASNNITSNFGKESTPQQFRLTITSLLPAPPAIVKYSGFAFAGNAGAESQSGSIDDVGIAVFEAQLATSSYLNASPVRHPDTSVNVGRIVPDHFGTAIKYAVPTMTCQSLPSASIPKLCPTLSGTGTDYLVYSRQPFDLTVTAYNLAGAVTTNYAGVLAKAVTLDTYDASAPASTNPPVNPAGSQIRWKDSNGNASSGLAASAFVSGKADTGASTSTSHPEYDFPTYYGSAGALVPPLTLRLRVKDADNVASQTAQEGYLSVVSGRLLVKNGYGAPGTANYMPVNLEAQYWNGASGNWAINPAYANSVSLSSGNVQFSNCKAQGNGSCPGLPVLAASPSTLNFASGVSSFNIRPTSSSPAYVDVAIDPTYWPLLYLPSASGRATFGVYKAGPVIYMREVF